MDLGDRGAASLAATSEAILAVTSLLQLVKADELEGRGGRWPGDVANRPPVGWFALSGFGRNPTAYDSLSWS